MTDTPDAENVSALAASAKFVDAISTIRIISKCICRYTALAMLLVLYVEIAVLPQARMLFNTSRVDSALDAVVKTTLESKSISLSMESNKCSSS